MVETKGVATSFSLTVSNNNVPITGLNNQQFYPYTLASNQYQFFSYAAQASEVFAFTVTPSSLNQLVIYMRTDGTPEYPTEACADFEYGLPTAGF